MSFPSTNYHGATLQLRALDGLVLVETRHPAGSRVAQHAHDAPTLCVPLSGGFEEVVGRARLAVAAPAVVARAAGDGAVRVHEIPAQSAAARAGLAPGDLITAVDGTPAADLGFTRLQALLRRAGTFALTVRRAGRSISVVLDNPSPAATPAASH